MSNPIPGIRMKALRWIPDDRGRLMECLRADDEMFIKCGQIYVTVALPGVVKGWHYHKVQTDNFIVVAGMAKIVCYDMRDDSPTAGAINEFFIGVHNPMLLQIPPNVLHGFKCISPEETMIINVPTEPYRHADPDEFRIPAHDPSIPYDWSRVDR